jgi:hypothetical protein
MVGSPVGSRTALTFSLAFGVTGAVVLAMVLVMRRVAGASEFSHAAWQRISVHARSTRKAAMLGIWKKRCTLCGAVATKGFRAPDRLNGFVCKSCYERWESDGRKCAACETSVRGVQEVGAFFEQRALGHADCGALKLFP